MTGVSNMIFDIFGRVGKLALHHQKSGNTLKHAGLSMNKYWN
jgi:hypothetical protein